MDCDDLLDAKVWRDGGVIHIDVSTLRAPDPFVATLRLIARPDIGNEIVFHNDREPIHLYPELNELGWQCRTEIDQPGKFCMRIIRNVEE